MLYKFNVVLNASAGKVLGRFEHGRDTAEGMCSTIIGTLQDFEFLNVGFWAESTMTKEYRP